MNKIAKDLVVGDKCLIMGTVHVVTRKSTYPEGGTTVEWQTPVTRSIAVYRNFSTFEIVE